MRKQIPLTEICAHFRIDLEVVTDFAEFGLFSTVDIDGHVGIDSRYLERLRRAISLYQALGVNKEGIEVILKLLEKVAGLQDEAEGLRKDVTRLKQRLDLQDPQRLKTLGLLIEID